MISATELASIAFFIGALWVFGIARAGAGVLMSARGAVAVMYDKGLDDAAREKAVRRASIQLTGAFFRSWSEVRWRYWPLSCRSGPLVWWVWRPSRTSCAISLAGT